MLPAIVNPPSLPAGTSVHSSKRMPALDGLRALSIMLVLLGHLSGTQGFPKNELHKFIGDYANLGVTIFFVISGFLITTLLIEEHEIAGSISLRLFYARRILRLFPAFALFILFLITLQFLGWIRLNPGDLRAALTYTVNFRQGSSWYIGHLWSLSVEEQFYLLWPAVLVLAGFEPSAWVAGGMILVSPVSRLLAVYHHVPGSIFPCVADSLACGCLLALCGERLRAQFWYTKLLAWRWFIPAAVILIVAANWLRYYLIGILFGVSVINVLVSLIVHRCVLTQSKITAFFSLPPLVGLGVLSYSLYLWQQFFLDHNSSWSICRFPMNLFTALLAACLSYCLVERPLNRFRKRLRLAPLPPTAAAFSDGRL